MYFSCLVFLMSALKHRQELVSKLSQRRVASTVIILKSDVNENVTLAELQDTRTRFVLLCLGKFPAELFLSNVTSFLHFVLYLFCSSQVQVYLLRNKTN